MKQAFKVRRDGPTIAWYASASCEDVDLLVWLARADDAWAVYPGVHADAATLVDAVTVFTDGKGTGMPAASQSEAESVAALWLQQIGYESV